MISGWISWTGLLGMEVWHWYALILIISILAGHPWKETSILPLITPTFWIMSWLTLKANFGTFYQTNLRVFGKTIKIILTVFRRGACKFWALSVLKRKTFKSICPSLGDSWIILDRLTFVKAWNSLLTFRRQFVLTLVTHIVLIHIFHPTYLQLFLLRRIIIRKIIVKFHYADLKYSLYASNAVFRTC